MLYNSRDGYIEVAFAVADEMLVSNEELFREFLRIAEVEFHG